MAAGTRLRRQDRRLDRVERQMNRNVGELIAIFLALGLLALVLRGCA